MLKKIYTILVLLKNLIIKRNVYNLRFVAEVDGPIKRWYYDFKHWGFAHGNLEMVCGADDLCEMYANGQNEVTVKVRAYKKQHPELIEAFDEFVAEDIPEDFSFIDKYLYGRNYNSKEEKMWICPVTLFVLGRYPKYLYIKRETVK